MYAQVEKSKDIKSRAVASCVAQNKSNVKQGFGFADHRYETNRTNELRKTVDNKYHPLQAGIAYNNDTVTQRVANGAIAGAVLGHKGEEQIKNTPATEHGQILEPEEVRAPVLPTPEDIRQRLGAAIKLMTDAAKALPAGIREQWRRDEPWYVEETINKEFAKVHGKEEFKPDIAEETEEITKTIEQNTENYRNYWKAVGQHLERICEHRTAYSAYMTQEETNLFEGICGNIERGDETADEIKKLCANFIEQVGEVSAQTSNGLYGMMTTGATKVQAAQLVAQYFAHGRLKINAWRTGYATKFDGKSGTFGAEWTLKTNEDELKEISKQWVFHTHASCDEAMNITISREMGASHIKRIEDAMELGVSLNFVDNTEFSRIEEDQETQKAFQGWVNRTARNGLSNSNKRK